MAADEPPFLPVGTEVSAKYRGAFCEAKVKKIVKCVKCKVLLKETNNGSLMVTDADINGSLKLGLTVEVKHPDSGEMIPAIITKMVDSSTYTVVFDDGDENTCRRTQLCLKGDKHFLQSETLDELPLTHPEHFGTPVMKNSKGLKKRRSGPGADSGSESESSDEEEEVVKRKTYGGRLQEMIGQVLCIEVEDRKKTLWVPALVVLPDADRTELKENEELLVKSFKDSKFYIVSKKDAKEFTRDMALKNDDKLLKAAFEKALQYYDSKELPSSWDKDELVGESDGEEESETSEDETNEEKDRFVATLYKFMDDRATPINKSPSISNRDLDLFRLFRVVQNLGGYNKVTNQGKWKIVYTKMNLPPNNSGSIQVKSAYKKYLHAFEDFYRKLGSTMGTISRPSRSRHSSGRSLVPFRERESPRSPRSDRSEKDEKEKSDKGDAKPKSEKLKTLKKDADEKSVKEESESETDTPRKTRTRATAQDKDKKDDKKPLTREELMKAALEEPPRTRKSAAKEEPNKNSKEDRTKATKDNKKAKETKDEVEENEESVPQKRTSARKRSARGEDPSKEDEPPAKKVDKKQISNIKNKKKKDDEESNGGPPSVHSSDGEEEEEEENDKEEDVREARESRSNGGCKEYPLGTKLKVKYGKGKHQKIYEAKVVEIETEQNGITYLVHYDGWNKRYDEWINKERIVSVVELPPESKKTPVSKKPVPQPSPKPLVKELKVKKEPKESNKPQHKRGRPAGSMTPPASRSSSETRLSKVKSPPTPSSASKPQRPTRANSIESRGAVVTPTKTRRTRRGSGFTESSDVQSHVSSDSEAEDNEDKVHEEKFASPLKKVEDPKPVPSPKAVTRNDAVVTETDTPLPKPMRMKTKAEMKERAKILDDIVKDEQKEQEKEAEETYSPEVDADQIMKDMLDIAKQKEEEALTAEKEEAKNVVKQELVQEKEEIETLDVVKTKAKKQMVVRGRRRLSDARKEDVVEQVKPEVEEAAEVKKDEGVSVKDNQTKGKKEKKEVEITKADDTPKKRGKSAGGKGKTEKGPKGKGKAEKLKAEEVEEEKKSDVEIEKNEKKKTKKKVKKKKEEVPKESDDDKSDISEKERENSEVPYLLPEIGPNRDRSVDKKPGLEGKDGSVANTNASLGTSVQPSSPPPRLTAIFPLTNAPDASPSRDASSGVSEEKDLKPLPALSAPHSPAKMDLPSSSVSSSITSPPSTMSLSQVPSLNKPDKTPKPAVLPSSSNQNQCSPPSQSSTVFENNLNTPPDTPQHSPASEQSNSEDSPSRDEPFCTKSEQEANLEVETLMGATDPPPGGDSPNACDMSTISNGSGGSSGNAPSSEESAEAPSTSSSNTTKRKIELEEVIPPPVKKRKQRHKRIKEEKAKPVKNMSDSDDAGGDAPSKGSPSKRSNELLAVSAVNALKADFEKLSPNRPSKFNFNLEEGNYLEGEERITFLMEKIGEIRKMYMNLKAEVACIDRRRKRHRRKEREAAQALANQMGLDLTS